MNSASAEQPAIDPRILKSVSVTGGLEERLTKRKASAATAVASALIVALIAISIWIIFLNANFE